MINNVPEIGNRSANAKTGMIKEQLEWSKNNIQNMLLNMYLEEAERSVSGNKHYLTTVTYPVLYSYSASDLIFTTYMYVSSCTG